MHKRRVRRARPNFSTIIPHEDRFKVVCSVAKKEGQWLVLGCRAQRGHCPGERGTLMDGHKGTIGLAETQRESTYVTCWTILCTPPPSCALPGTFAPQLGLIPRATDLRPGELKALFITDNLVVPYSDLVELTSHYIPHWCLRAREPRLRAYRCLELRRSPPASTGSKQLLSERETDRPERLGGGQWAENKKEALSQPDYRSLNLLVAKRTTQSVSDSGPDEHSPVLISQDSEFHTLETPSRFIDGSNFEAQLGGW
ncbi:hypothetical protein Q8A73_016297 [Channa argus]|nr:hypothetical protein Q8A73_016297 [Channa argus]